ncbi:MAG: hypothetical protein AAF196_03030 [Planctomycetota bacterium]
MPLDAPDVLVGKRGVRAYRVHELGEHSAIYALESFAELLPRQDPKSPSVVELQLRGPETEAEKAVPGFWIHPAITDDLRQIVPHVVVTDRILTPTATRVAIDSKVLKRYRLEFANETYAVVVWLDLRPRSPVVEFSAIVLRRDRKANGLTQVILGFGEPVRHKGEVHRSGWVQDVLSLDTAGVGVLRGAILCQSRTIKGADAEAYDLDDATVDALAAAEQGPFFGFPTRWPGDWLLAPVPDIDPSLANEQKGHLIQRWLSQGERPHTSQPHPHAPGNQASFGVSYFLPFLGEPRPEITRALLWNAEDWLDRPVHFQRRGTVSDPVRFIAGMRTKSRRPYTDRGANEFQRLGIPPVPGLSELRRRKGHDDEHAADMPLLAAYALTGDPVLRWCMRSHLGMDLNQIQLALSSAGKGRAEGRVGINMLASGVLLGGQDLALVVAHLEKRVRDARAQQDRHGGPIGIENDPRTHADLPAHTPYEEAQAAYAFWTLYQVSGSEVAKDAAWTAASLVADSIFLEDGRPWVPYRVSLDAIASELNLSSSKVHPGEWIHWSAPAFGVFLDLAPSDDRRRAKVEGAVEWLRSKPMRRLSDLHLAGPVL